MTVGERIWVGFGLSIQIAGWPIALIGGQIWIIPLLLLAAFSLYLVWSELR